MSAWISVVPDLTTLWLHLLRCLRLFSAHHSNSPWAEDVWLRLLVPGGCTSLGAPSETSDGDSHQLVETHSGMKDASAYVKNASEVLTLQGTLAEVLLTEPLLRPRPHICASSCFSPPMHRLRRAGEAVTLQALVIARVLWSPASAGCWMLLPTWPPRFSIS